jgi:hypothetical protein
MAEGSPQQVRVERAFCLQQDGLIVMMSLGELLLKEPALDGCERDRAAHTALLGPARKRFAHDSRQFGDGSVFKDLPGSQRQTGVIGAGDNLQAEDGIAP